MTQILLDASFLETLKSASSIEEMQTMITTAEKNITLVPETPEQAYSRLMREFEHLDGVSITRQKACEKYNLVDVTIYSWETRGLVRVIQKAKRRGLHTYINERDVAVMAEMNKKFRKGPGGPIAKWKPQLILQAS